MRNYGGEIKFRILKISRLRSESQARRSLAKKKEERRKKKEKWWWRNDVSHFKDFSTTLEMTGKAEPCNQNLEFRIVNCGGETKFRILILLSTFYILH